MLIFKQSREIVQLDYFLGYLVVFSRAINSCLFVVHNGTRSGEHYDLIVRATATYRLSVLYMYIHLRRTHHVVSYRSSYGFRYLNL